MKSCLVVDDSKIIRKVARRILEELNFDIKEAVDGQDALDNCKGSMPDVVLLDWNMPVMNGFEFLDHIRKDKKLNNTVVFILTTSNEDNDRTRAYHNNVAGYMVKHAIGPQFAKLTTLMDMIVVIRYSLMLPRNYKS